VRDQVATLRYQHRRLASHGKHYPVERVRTARMRRGKLTHWHVVVADWRDEKGEPREAISDPFHYDPASLLDARRLQVIADPFDPELCLVPSSQLPPPSKWRLDRAQRAQVNATEHPGQRLLWIVLTFICVGMAGYVIVTLSRLL
jgi:hypothetical protein